MSEAVTKSYKNVSKNSFQLKPRVRGQAFFMFHPGDIIQPVDAEEAALLDRTDDAVECDPAPLSEESQEHDASPSGLAGPHVGKKKG
jgi:hypothetical protein